MISQATITCSYESDSDLKLNHFYFDDSFAELFLADPTRSSSAWFLSKDMRIEKKSNEFRRVTPLLAKIWWKPKRVFREPADTKEGDSWALLAGAPNLMSLTALPAPQFSLSSFMRAEHWKYLLLLPKSFKFSSNQSALAWDNIKWRNNVILVHWWFHLRHG